MIITITGKPCSGKGTTAKLFCEKFGFEYIATGNMFREFAKQYGYNSILDFQKQSSVTKQIDKLIDDKTIEIGKQRLNDNIVFDSRLAWHFIPNSFKVFIDLDDKTAAERLLGTNRDTEQVSTFEEALEKLKARWNTENSRYQELYSIDNLNPSNYDFIINSKNLTPNQIVDEIYKKYLDFINNKK